MNKILISILCLFVLLVACSAPEAVVEEPADVAEPEMVDEADATENMAEEATDSEADMAEETSDMGTSEDVIRIGFSAPLTGDAATYGIDEQRGTLLALEDIEKAGWINGKQLEFIYEDDKCNGKDATTVANKLVNVDKVKVVVGSSCSGATLSLAPITNEAQVILLTSYASNSKIKDAGDFVFRSIPSDAVLGKRLADAVNSKSKKVAIITENTDYAQGLRDEFTKRAGELGLEIVASESFEPDNKDYRTQLTKIKAVSPDALFVNTQADTGLAQVMKQAFDLGLEVQMYAAYFGGSRVVTEVLSEKAEGLIWADLLDPKFSDNGKALIDRYEEKFGSVPVLNSAVALAYDRTMIIANALKACGEDSICIRDWLYNMDAYNGITGNVEFDEDGEAVGVEHAIYVLKAGEPELVEDLEE